MKALGKALASVMSYDDVWSASGVEILDAFQSQVS
ncbi:MAG: hypothetical protein ACI9CV_001263 [Ilumatobacter sp.]